MQTHISHVFLVGDRVYKLHKSVRLPFLDFSERAERNADCLREVALNRRLSPSVYLGVAPILAEGDEARVGPLAETIEDPDREHFVVMRRLPEGTDALAMLERGELEPLHLEAVSDRLRPFHADNGLGRPAPWSPEAWHERIAAPVLESAAAIGTTGLIEPARVASLDASIRSRLEALSDAFEQRRLEGRAIDGHGDLHLDHLWFETPAEPPLLIDCLEFDDALRRVDVASELAFLAMDLRYRGRADLGEAFLAHYALHTDDYGLYTVVDFFTAYRSLVRAKVAALAAGQSSVPAEQRRAARGSLEAHLALAETLLAGSADGISPGVVVLCGTVGCGKSSVARALARTGRGVPIASDRVRKARLAQPAEQRLEAGVDEGPYRPEARERVYAAMLERAEPVVASGRTVILDAGYAARRERERVRRWAEARALPARLIEVRCAPETALERLRARKQAATDPSDAGPELLATSLDRFEPPSEWPAEAREVVHTDRTGWEAQLGRHAGRELR